ncbi:MAG: hypothetical protein AB1649_17770 [Chloroflexota bacterium]
MFEGIEIDVTRCILPLVALLIGWVIGFFDSNRRTSSKIKDAENKAEAAVKEAQAKVVDAESKLSVMAAVTPQENSLLRLNKDGEALTLHIDGQAVFPPNLTPEHRKRLIGLITLMRPWLEGDAAQQAVARTVTVAPTAPEPAPVFPTPLITSAKAEPEKPAPPPSSIVEQIDAILQRRMLNTPLVRMDIRLQESHEGGVEVMVGKKRYETVDEVPDPEIRAAIRAAIDEWEKKYTPGL